MRYHFKYAKNTKPVMERRINPRRCIRNEYSKHDILRVSIHSCGKTMCEKRESRFARNRLPVRPNRGPIQKVTKKDGIL